MPVLINAVVLAAYALAPGARPAPMAGGAHRCTRVRAARMGFFENFFEELDNTIDDFANKRLGNGANFYGKRKSNIYGEGDAMRKRDSRSFDREEDYTGPGGGSYFVLSKERDAQVAAPPRRGHRPPPPSRPSSPPLTGSSARVPVAQGGARTVQGGRGAEMGGHCTR